MYMGMAIAAQGDKVLRGIGAAFSARDGVMHLQPLRRIAQGTAVSVAAVDLFSDRVGDVCVHRNASFAFSP